jgi:hypothetical protein
MCSNQFFFQAMPNVMTYMCPPPHMTYDMHVSSSPYDIGFLQAMPNVMMGHHHMYNNRVGL